MYAYRMGLSLFEKVGPIYGQILHVYRITNYIRMMDGKALLLVYFILYKLPAELRQVCQENNVQ